MGGGVLRLNSAQNRHKLEYPRDPDNWYVEQPWVSAALFKAERFINKIWDPCCGCGNIVQTAWEFGHTAIGSDLRARWSQQADVRNFLTERTVPSGPFDIIFNPPYIHGDVSFIVRAFEVAHQKVAALMQAPFRFSFGRHAFFRDNPPSVIYTLSDRPSMPPGAMLAEGIIRASGGKEDYEWYVWDKSYRGETRNRWLLNPDAPATEEELLAGKRKQRRVKAQDLTVG